MNAIEDHALARLTPLRPAVELGHRTGTRIHIFGRAPAPPPAASPGDRRRADRLPPAETPWADVARLRTGHEVRVLDISTTGVLVVLSVRLQIGGRIEVSLTEADTDNRLVVTGVARRCHVASLNPMTYVGALEFERELDPAMLQPFVASSHSA
ncbi:MAG TPA: PilZ domain-containing protein [Vicinamibacterales bacterium]|nr:PilZ domain-containing protein [Vicinamibacterales bacterium]